MGWNKLLLVTGLLLLMSIAKAKDLDSMLAQYPRAMQAAIHTEGFWQEKFAEHQLPFPPPQLFLRAYKLEKVLEVWAGQDNEYRLIKTYDICMIPGQLGPKIRQGDKQVPEGIYIIDTLNPDSDFHLSMRINYPNEADLIRSAEEKDPGGDIYIHGDCYSVGCLPMEDEPIEELFWLVAVHQHLHQGTAIPVHLFPFRFTKDSNSDAERHFPQWASFWQDLKAIDLHFNRYKIPASVQINREGRYFLGD
jgi:murein L,D-transpeptidase YafK